MGDDKYEVLKSKFLEAYANVPEPLRREIIAIVNNEPFTWFTARAEILSDTKNGKTIIEHLNKMGVLQ